MHLKKETKILIVALILYIVTFLSAFLFGKYKVSFIDLINAFFNSSEVSNPNVLITVYKIRLPRIIMSMLIGSGLAVAGCSYQALFQNPIVSSDILGASAGAGFGAALGILLGFNYMMVSLTAFSTGILAIFFVYLISLSVRNNKTLGLVLGGMLISSLFSSLLSFVKLVADPTNVLPVITYWLMGSLNSIKLHDMYLASPIILVSIIILFIIRYRMNVLALGEVEAKVMGINYSVLRVVIIVFSTLITAISVAVSGMIGWISLVIPHLARLIIGNDYRYVIPLSILLGGSFLTVIDTLARNIASSEIPIGILTSIIGAPIFMYLIIREGKRI